MGCGESKHAVSTQNTISLNKRSNSKKNTEEKVVINGDGNAPVVKEEKEEAPQSGNENVGDQQTVKDKDNKEASPPVPVPVPNPAPVGNGDGNVKEDEKVEKEKPMVEDVKEAEEKEVSSSSSSAADKAAVADGDEGKEGEEEKKELKEENPIEPKMEDAKILDQPIDEAKKDASEEVVKEKEPTKEAETHQEAKNDKVLEDQKEGNIETVKAEAVESAEAKDSAHNDADEKIPTPQKEIEVESAAEAEKKAD